MKVNEKLSVLLLLEKSKQAKDGKIPITIRLTIDGKRAEMALGQKVLPELWDQDAGRVIGNSGDARIVNAEIDKARTKIRKVYTQLEIDNDYITSAQVKKVYQGKPVQVKKVTLLEATKFVVDKMALKVEKKKCQPATLTKWKTTETKLTEFLSEVYQQSDIALEDIKYAFAEDFVDYLMLQKDIQSNTAMKYLKNTKHILKASVDRDWLVKSPIASYQCCYIHPERDILNKGEILALYNKKIEIDRIREVRDAFLFMCFTGYAYKDVSILTPKHLATHFDDELWIIKNREKTWCRENVPVLPIAKEIIDRYQNHPYCKAKDLLLPINSNQKFNAYLKELADICGIEKKLTTHIARHTFATTITLANGVPLETVSALLGHRSIKTTQVYAKIVAEKVSWDMGQLKETLIIKMPESMLSKAA